MTLPAFDIAEAKKMRDAGQSFESIARALGVSSHRIRVALIPGYGQRRAAAIRANRKGRSSALRSLHIESDLRPSAATIRDAELQLAQRPPDTRGFTAKLFGDPEPWRSALAQRRDA